MADRYAVITGTTSGIGKAITYKLLNDGWHVHGIARRSSGIDAPNYVHHIFDLSEGAKIAELTKEILSRSKEIHALINNAGIASFAPHEEIPARAITHMVNVNLLAPLLLTRDFLRALKNTRGWVINLSSFSSYEASSFGAAYSATKAGIRHFGTSLFDEVRKSGVKVVTVSPDITKTPFYDDQSFAPEENSDAYVTDECVAEAVSSIMTQRDGTVISEIVLRPQRILLRKRSGMT